MESRCTTHLEQQQEEETSSLKTKLVELSPDVFDSRTQIEKKPSWLPEGPIQKFDKCVVTIPAKGVPNKISYYNGKY